MIHCETEMIFSTETSRLLEVSVPTVLRLAASGQLKGVRTADGTWLFRRSEVEELARQRVAAKQERGR